jgi:hypothetical protein
MEYQFQTTPPQTDPFQTTPKVESIAIRAISRLLSIGIVSVAVAFLMYLLEARDIAMGKAAFLANEASMYDRYPDHPQLGPMIVIFFLIVFFLLAYELIAYVIYKVISLIHS